LVHPDDINQVWRELGERHKTMSALCAGSQMAPIGEIWRNTPAATTHAPCEALFWLARY
jgi:hypothetical protein